MSQFSNFREYIFQNLFPYWYQENDSYKNHEGKGILQRFIEVCAEYFDNEVLPGIDNMMDNIDLDKTSTIFLNYIWQYFDYIPYAYGVLVNNSPYTTDNINSWLSNPDGFPKADTRALLKYAISLFKIRGTYSFYRILGRFYGVDIIFEEIPAPSTTTNSLSLQSVVPTPSSSDEVIVDPSEISEPLTIATINNGSSWYDRKKAGYNQRDCLSCVYFKVYINIPEGMWEEIDKQAQEDPDRWSDVLRAFNDLITKYLPVYARLSDENGEENVILQKYYHTLQVFPPPPNYAFSNSQGKVELDEEGTTGK